MSGGGLGTGAGGLLGTLAGVALAPETGGLSMAIPALTGAAGAELGNMATGNTQNPLMAAFMGGVGGGLGGATDIGGSLGISNSAGLFGDTAAPVASNGSSALSDIGLGANSSQVPDSLPSLDGSASAAADQTAIPSTLPSTAGSAPPPDSGSGIGNWLGKSQNLKNLGIGAGLGLPALEGVMQQFTLPKYNVAKTANSVLSQSPGFTNPNLPAYTMQNTGTPYSGNWYTYGAQGNPAMYNAMPQPAKHGGMMHYAHGGQVQNYAGGGMASQVAPPVVPSMYPVVPSRYIPSRNYAMGGNVLPPAMGAPPMPQQAAPQGMPQQAMPSQMPPQGAAHGQPQKPINPLMLKVAHEVGIAVGEHIKRKRTPAGPINGVGGGQDDAIPARLSDGEYVHSADVVAALGDGSTKDGGKKLAAMDAAVRAHKTSKGSKFPPKAHNPLAYIKKAST